MKICQLRYSNVKDFWKHEFLSHNGQMVLVNDRGSSYYYTHINFPQPMRTAPTMSESYIDSIHKPGVGTTLLQQEPNFTGKCLWLLYKCWRG